MKNLFITSCLTLVLALGSYASAQTNAPAPSSNSASFMEKTANSLDAALAEAITKASSASGKVWDFTATTIGKAVDTVQTETPKLIEEFLTWKFAESLVYFSVGFGVIAFMFFLVWRFRKYAKKGYAQYEVRGIPDRFIVAQWFGTILPLIVAGLVFGHSTIDHITTMVKIKYAPRVYLVEYVAELMKPACPRCGSKKHYNTSNH